MAGVGFELKKLFHEQGLFKSVKAYAYSSLTTVGPIALCMLMIIGMQAMMTYAGSPYKEKELFLATIVYAFIFSVLLTGGLSMILTRFIADMMFLKKYEHLLSSFYGSCAVCLPIGGPIAWIFLYDMPVSLSYKYTAYIFFAELIVICLGSVHLSAVKDYKRIVRNYLIGVSTSFGGVWLIFTFTPYRGTTTVLAMIDIGFFILILLMVRHFEQRFPEKDSKIYFEFLTYLKKYPALFFVGTFLYSGVYTHSFVYWSGSYNLRIAEKYVISPFYDTPVFYAYLTVVPTLVTFVVSVETAFYEKFRNYYTHILSDGTIMDISRAKEEMQKTLMQEISFLMEVQLLFTVISIALGIKLLPMLGFTYEQLFTFNILSLGYYLFIVAFILMLLLLYFDDRKGVLWLSGLFVLLNTSLSYWFMQHENHGMGMFLSSLITLLVCLTRLMAYVQNIDYYTFCSQPIVPVRKPSIWRKWVRFKKVPTAGVLIVLVFLLGACTNESTETSTAASGQPVKVPSTNVISELQEDKRIYDRDEDTSVTTFYLTILPNNDNKKKYSWYEMNRITTAEEENELNVIIQEGAADGSGPASGSWGYGKTDTNGKISLRGNSSRYRSQRSYKIKLNDQMELWHDQKIINLNKHSFDPTRMANKISFDIFEELQNITSLRTQFVHLYVKDLSEGTSGNSSYQDYGLYTHIEQPNQSFLKNHWLDPYGQLYKANMFEFFRYEDQIVSQTASNYDKVKFESVLEIRGREEHDKLIAMLEDVNNKALPIDEVIEKHFDLNNYLTWLASNILMDNMDTNAQNFFLYSPLNSKKWYFLPWDYDGAWELQRIKKSIGPYNIGISNYWGSMLHRRFLSIEKNVMLLKDKIDELYETINKDTVSKRITDYRSIVEPYLLRMPDKQFLPVSMLQWEVELNRLKETPLRSMQRFKEDLEKPRPVFLGDVETQDNKMVFVWDLSFDLQKDDISYDWILSSDPGLTNIVDKVEKITDTRIAIKPLPKGTYYWTIKIYDSKGHSQTPFENYIDEEGINYYGIRQIKVE